MEMLQMEFRDLGHLLSHLKVEATLEDYLYAASLASSRASWQVKTVRTWAYSYLVG